MKVGDIVRVIRHHDLGIFLGEYVSVNQTTGEEYVCAEVMWLRNNQIQTCSFSTIEVVKEAA